MRGVERGSIACDDRRAKGVVEANGAHVDVLLDALGAGHDADGWSEGPEADAAAISHEQMIVFDANRPAGRKLPLQSGSDRTAPTGFCRLAKGNPRHGRDAIILVVGHCGAALRVPKHAAPGVADLAREQAKRVDL